MGALSKQTILREYIDLGKSDNEIAKVFGIHRTAVTHFRHHHGIKTRNYTGSVGEGHVIEFLSNLCVRVKDMNKISKTYPFDLLINNTIRVDVKSAMIFKRGQYGCWVFTLANSSEASIEANNKNYIKLSNGKVRKDFFKTCDIIMLCGILSNGSFEIFIIPPKVIPLTQQTILITNNKKGPWWKWHNRVDILFDAINKKRMGGDPDGQA